MPLVVSSYRNPVLAVILGLVFIQGLALWWRRRFPLAVLVLIVCVAVASWVITPDREPTGTALAFGAYAVSVYGAARARLWVAGASIAIIVAAVVLLLLGDFAAARNLIPGGALSLVAWVVGDYIRGRRTFLTELIARHRRESDALRREAVEEERLRIARELHDVVAHNVSVMAIQAGAARVAGKSDSASVAALQSIESTARDTLAELNRLLGVLRKETGQPPMSPQPGLDQIDGLLKAAKEAGLDADLKITGEQHALPTSLDLTAYRIVQEAITNTLKHAHASRLEVRIAYQPDALELTVRDNGGGVSEEAVLTSTGHGLIGMRERVELFGGELEAGSHDLGGGFTVHSRLPLTS
ncbi:MAG TPA: sensor histidine kinase [Candidatus Acidoferrum sp.]|nr:sensor histidine kinase [Candidatus Acidoferrum sp.]